MKDTQTIPLACVPGAIPADERDGHFALARRLFGEAVLERRGGGGGDGLRLVPVPLCEGGRVRQK